MFGLHCGVWITDISWIIIGIEGTKCNYCNRDFVISNSLKGPQALLNVCIAWCKWSDILIRIDKCTTFGMTKKGGQYIQFQPGLFIDDVAVPSILPGESFVYFGKRFDFAMDDGLDKVDISTRLQDLITQTSNLPVRPQSKLKILKMYITSQLSFDLKTYNLSTTWITKNLDSKICNAVRSWLELPISTCMAELLALSQKKGGHDIRSLKTTAQILRLGQRIRLKNSGSTRMEILWQVTSAQFPTIDEHITDSNSSIVVPVRKLKEKIELEAWSHVQSLSVQGALLKSLSASLGASIIKKWTCHVSTMTSLMFKFVRKAIQQQLPTAANLKRWGKQADPSCPLCNNIQLNKHVLSNCSSVGSRFGALSISSRSGTGDTS